MIDSFSLLHIVVYSVCSAYNDIRLINLVFGGRNLHYSEMVSEFLRVRNNVRYSAELKNFEMAITYILGEVNDVTLQGIRSEDIIQSIDYLVDSRIYFTKSIALKYMSAIAQFFRFSTQHRWFSNTDFLNTINSAPEERSSYFYKLTRYIDSNDLLAAPIQKDPLNYDELISLLNYIDDYFDSCDFEINISKYAALLAMKLILFTGIKFLVLTKIRIEDVSLEINQILINGYKIRMPILFTEQVRKYLSISSTRNTKLLFSKDNGQSWQNTTDSKIDRYLKQILLRSDTTGLTKYGIQQLLIAGTDIPTIEKFTRAGKDIIYSCGDERSANIGRQITQTDIYYLC